MKRELIPAEKLLVRINYLWAKKWMLLTSGDFNRNDYNTMTVAWGSVGVMWNKPFVQVVVRPTRYTYGFMELNETFTLCAFPEKYKDALEILGTKSGRDGNKIKEACVTPVASKKVAAPCFSEAELVIECKKIYYDDLDPANFLDKDIDNNYPLKDYHRIYFGEMIAIFGNEEIYRV